MSVKYSKPKPMIILLIISLTLIIIYLFSFKTYDFYQITSLISCQEYCQITFDLIGDQLTNQINYLIIDNKKISIQNILFDLPNYSAEYNILTQTVHISFSLDYSYNNQLKNITILADKQSIIKKFIKKFL